MVLAAAADSPQFAEAVGAPYEAGPWYNSSVAITNGGHVATVTLPVRGSRRSSDVTVRVRAAARLAGFGCRRISVAAQSVRLRPGGGLLCCCWMQPQAPRPVWLLLLLLLPLASAAPAALIARLLAGPHPNTAQVVRKGGLRSTLLHNTVGAADWDVLVMQALVGMGAGGRPISLSLLPQVAPPADPAAAAAAAEALGHGHGLAAAAAKQAAAAEQEAAGRAAAEQAAAAAQQAGR